MKPGEFKLRLLEQRDDFDWVWRYEVVPYPNLRVISLHDPCSHEVISFALQDVSDPFSPREIFVRPRLIDLRRQMKVTDLTFRTPLLTPSGRRVKKNVQWL